jgi:hypothetical protein
MAGSARPQCHLTVDVDPLRCYAAIHGLEVPQQVGPGSPWNAAYEKGMLRFLDAFGRFGVRATFFVVASDLEQPINRGIIREAARRGHEIACHTLTHPYDFDRLPEAEQEREVGEAVRLLNEVTGARVVGFRAPGYNFRPEMVPLLTRHGLRYDASLLPSRGYFLLRAAMIAKIRLTGGHSRSQLGRWANFASSGRPTILARAGGVLRENPISVLPTGFPMVGTFLNLLGPERLHLVLGQALAANPLHLEFHAVDLVELERDRLPPELKAQKDLALPLTRKLAVLERILEAVRGRFQVVPLAEAGR